MLHKQQVPLKVAVLGAKAVGKSAISVRFLTKRYIGDYSSDTDHLYQCSVPHFKGHVQLLDVTGDCLKKSEDESSEILHWATGLVLVYSICDRSSFQNVQQLLVEIERIAPHLNLVLIGNKSDLEAGRKVEFEEGKALAAKHSTQFYELSAADQWQGIAKAFESLMQLVSKSPYRHLYSNKNQLVLCSVTSNILSSSLMGKQVKKTSITTPFQLLVGTVISATQRKYSFSRKNKLVKQSFSAQSAPEPSISIASSPIEQDMVKSVKSRSHSAPQFLMRRKDTNASQHCSSAITNTVDCSNLASAIYVG